MSILVISKTCHLCGKSNEIEVSKADIPAYWKWREGALMQSVLPHWTPGQREALISGSHEECWDEFLKPEGDDV